MIQDKTLLGAVDVFAGLDKNGYVVINSKENPEKVVPEIVKMLPKGHVFTVPATDFAMQKIGKPLPGAPMLASLAAVTGILKLESVQKAFQARYPGKIGDANAETATLAYNFIKEEAKNA